MFRKKEKRRPKVGLGVIVHREGRVLVGKRKNSHGSGNWGFPGGHIEWNETFEECALRELEEETGMRGRDPKFISATNDVMPLDDQHYITVFMLVEDFDGEPELREPEKCEGWEWIRWDDLPEQRFSPITRLIEKGYHPHPSTKHNKLVRDKIPDVIRENGEEAVIRVADSDEYRGRLRMKLFEEAVEYIESEEVEELADMLEVIYTLAKLRGASPDMLERLRQEKRAVRGGFDNRIILEETR